MNQQPSGKITKGYAFGLISAVVIFVAALLIAGWGLLSLFTEQSPVDSSVPTFLAPLLIFINLLILWWILWQQTLSLLRSNKPAWSLLIVAPGVAYLVWSLGGSLAGMSIAETWLSVFAFSFLLIWPAGLLIFWALLLRRLYSSKEAPKWPWERAEEDQ